jgi:energy-converting hydrogenase Eha subunit A
VSVSADTSPSQCRKNCILAIISVIIQTILRNDSLKHKEAKDSFSWSSLILLPLPVFCLTLSIFPASLQHKWTKGLILSAILNTLLNTTEAKKNKWVKLLCVAYINPSLCRENKRPRGKKQRGMV